MTRGSLTEVGEEWGDFVASVSVEGRGSVGNVEGFSDLSREPLLLPHQDLDVIQCVMITSGRGVSRDGRVEVFSICHHYTLDDTKMLVREKWFPQKIREVLHIHKRSPALNKD